MTVIVVASPTISVALLPEQPIGSTALGRVSLTSEVLP